MIALIRTLQIILHLPLMSIKEPTNVQMVFGIIIPIAMFDIFDGEISEIAFRYFDLETHGELVDMGSINEKFVNLDY